MCFFPIQLGIVIPNDFHIFQRGRSTTNQINLSNFAIAPPHPRTKDMSLMAQLGSGGNDVASSSNAALAKEFTRELDAAPRSAEGAVIVGI